MRTTIKSILKEISCPKLDLYQGKGYLYFVYNDPANDVYDTESVYVYRLSDLPKQRWIEDGKAFVSSVQSKIGA